MIVLRLLAEACRPAPPCASARGTKRAAVRISELGSGKLAPPAPVFEPQKAASLPSRRVNRLHPQQVS